MNFWDEPTVQLEGFFNFPPIPVGNKTERKEKFLPLCDSTHSGGNTAMKTQVFFSGTLSGIAEGWLESYVLYLAWPEWKGLKFYSLLWFHPFRWKHRGIAGGSLGEYHKLTGNVTGNVAFGTPQPIPWIRPRMYVRRSIMYEKAVFCSPEENSSTAWFSVPLKFDKLRFLHEFYLQVNKA